MSGFIDRLEVLFVGFSAYSNIKRVFDVTRRPEAYIPCLDFLRFVSFGWVLFGHTWLFGPIVNELWQTGACDVTQNRVLAISHVVMKKQK